MAETTLELNDGSTRFPVTVFEASEPACTGLFAVGAGGNPLRHAGLLRDLANRGCTLIAPHCPMLSSPVPSKDELVARIRQLELAAEQCARGNQPLVGVGHSIGAVCLLTLAGAEPWTVSGRVEFKSQRSFSRLALLTPPTGFFRAPDALTQVRSELYVRAGAEDSITPPEQAWFLQEALDRQTTVELRVDEAAGHFTYMDELPPTVSDPHPDRSAFLSELALDLARFLVA
jgi:hypothetical protein